ncbi:MAG TPA: hypothetical protein EYP43_00085 [Thermoplasmata archaeon]|nr:hypothetical protein [Thermoplasmata archaeon]
MMRKWFPAELAAIALAAMLVLPGMMTNVGGQVYVRRIVKESGETEAFGGGEYVGIRFGLDSLFAVVYGTDENPNSIVIFASVNRYLGRATVLDENHAALAMRRPLIVRTIYAIRLSALFEFNDTNGDGICNVVRLADGLEVSDLARHEPIYKAVDLRTAWERGKVTAAGNATERWKSWEFTLTARNLSYISMDGTDTNDTLGMVRFRFRLMAYLTEETVEAPRYRLIVESPMSNHQGGMMTDDLSVLDADVIETENEGTENVTIDVLRYRTKVDHIIEGWDIDPTNANPGLLLETHSTLGNAMSYAMLAWVRDQHREGTTAYETENGTEEIDGTDATTDYAEDQRPRRLKHPRMDVNDAWGRVGRFTWTKNVSVTRGNSTSEEEMYYQVQCGRRVTWVDDRGLYSGYYVLGGFSYPAGDRVVHDPEMEAKSYGQEYAREEEPLINEGMIMAVLLFIIIVVAIPILVILFRKL